ncbi:hypothetical protein SprV_1002812200 [Sparganum proliferum]
MYVGSTLSYSIKIDDEVDRRISKVVFKMQVRNRYGLHISPEPRDAQGGQPVANWTDCGTRTAPALVSPPISPAPPTTGGLYVFADPVSAQMSRPKRESPYRATINIFFLLLLLLLNVC